jgi:hypothetical protein
MIPFEPFIFEYLSPSNGPACTAILAGDKARCICMTRHPSSFLSVYDVRDGAGIFGPTAL